MGSCSSPRRTNDAAWFSQRLTHGMERAITLLQAKALVGLLRVEAPPAKIIAQLADYGARHLNSNVGFTELAIAGNLLPALDPQTTYLLLLRCAQTIASAAVNMIRYPVPPLEAAHEFSQLERWYGQWMSSRDRDGVERVLMTAIEGGASTEELTRMVFGAISQSVYRLQGHAFDLSNKQFELLHHVGFTHAADILPVGVAQWVAGRGAEESAAWHHPIELIEPLRAAEARLPELLAKPQNAKWTDGGQLGPVLLGEDPLAILQALEKALSDGAAPADLSKHVAYAAAMRLARFAKSNEVGDWFNPQHSFTFANAVYQALRRCSAAPVSRAIYHAALAVYMDRFLNVPPAALPGENRAGAAIVAALPPDAEQLRADLLACFEERASLEPAARLVVRYVRLGHPLQPLINTLAYATVREDLDFHTLQVLEAGWQQINAWADATHTEHILVGVVRNLAAVCPTRRAQFKIATTAWRLSHGEKIFEE